MKSVIFEKLFIQNFLSIGSEPVIINFNTGLNIITGINKDKEDSKNGVGKSSISDALFFAIFGTPLRAIKKDDIINWKAKDTCIVELTFKVIDNNITNEYKLTRTVNPSRIQLIKNGEDVSRTIARTNEAIADIIGTTSDIFEQSVIMSVNQTEPFMAKTPAIKRKFIEGIFKLEVFSVMLNRIREDYNDTKKLFDTERVKSEEISRSLDVYKRQQTEQREYRENRIKVLEGRRVNNTREIEESSKKLKTISKDDFDKFDIEIKKYKDKQSLIEEDVKTLMSELTVNQSTIMNIKHNIDELSSLKNDICTHCKRAYTSNDLKTREQTIAQYTSNRQEIYKLIQSIHTKIASNDNKIKQYDLLIEAEKNKKHELELEKLKIDHLRDRINQCEIWNRQIAVDIAKLLSEAGNHSDLILDTEKRLNAINLVIQEYKQKIAIYDTSKFIVSDEGIKSLIIKKMLKMLNSRLNLYLEKLDANCVCTFDEYFEESIYNNHGNKCSYFNFSGGERKRIDLAILFTFMDIRRLQSNISINISFYDELLDSSLDSKGIENTLEILKDRINQYNESIYVISHKSEAIKHATEEIVYLEKEHGITRKVPYILGEKNES